MAKTISEPEYLTPAGKFIVQRRGNPVLTEIPSENLAAIGLTRDTWKVDAPGKSEIRCRTINGNGVAQPMPRPFGRSGTNRIEVAKITAESA